eukprot:TRINITY_DN29576_c0_g1_i2.p1 TRINITY_DN29576_c0_g1~~TRINITY_DN29576_c0_g1_i2.p1  ORF type:complete len:862 (+),score=139.80 TRINITY_DN29576_c0_g1_i2:101-2686(+)
MSEAPYEYTRLQERKAQPVVQESKGRTTLLRPEISVFTEAEVDAFVRLSAFAVPNPRKIKRITNLYILSRLLCPDRAHIRDKLMAWIFLCEQWPVRMAWILQVLEDNSQLVGHMPLKDQDAMSLYEFYEGFVEKRVFQSMMPISDIANGSAIKLYAETYALDADPELFALMLSRVDLKLSDVGGLRWDRESDKLASYTLNLSPGLRHLVARLASYRHDDDKLRELDDKAFSGLSHMSTSAQIGIKPRWSRKEGKEKKNNATFLSEVNTRNEAAKIEKELAQAKATFKDDKDGTDHIGYSQYARALSQLVTLFIDTPCVFGLFATWGTGKSFTMNKITTYIRACSISKVVAAHGCDEEHVKLLEDIAHVAQDDAKTELIFRWLVSGADEAAIQSGKRITSVDGDVNLDAGVVESRWTSRQYPSKPDLDLFEPFTFLTTLASVLYSGLVSFMRLFWCSACYQQNSQLQLLRQIWHANDLEDCYDYEFVWFNAWMFCGSDNLWAGLVIKLHEAVEAHFGPVYSEAEFEARKIACFFKIGSAAMLLMLCLALSPAANFALTGETGEIWETDLETVSTDIVKKITSFSVAGVSLGVIVEQMVKFLKSGELRPSKALTERASKEDFKKKLGFMDDVKSEIDRLTGYLKDPSTIPTVWDIVIPDNAPARDSIVKMAKCLSQAYKRARALRKCRIVIFVDDLDRCPPSKVIEVLQALVLLSENTPFITFLGVDPRVIVSAIESDNSGFFREQGISGHEYLDKIINVPFTFPSLSDSEKAALFRGYMTGDGTPKQLKFVDADGDTCLYSLTDDGGMALKVTGKNGTQKYQGRVREIQYVNGELFDGVGSAPLNPDDSLTDISHAIHKARD